MIVPQIPKGFRDFLPNKMIVRQKIIKTMIDVFEAFGFEPLDTPCLEYAETLQGKYGEEGDKLIYKFQDRGGRALALRYDLTIPLCRVIATYADLTKPFKRYQIAPVWRADKPQKGRFREFYQCDIDIIGSASAYADGELLIITYSVLRKLGFDDFVIRINNRKILNAFAVKEGISEKDIPNFFRSLDKLDKVGKEGVIKELNSKGLLSKSLEMKLIDFVFSEEPDNPQSFSAIRKLAEGISVGDEGIKELEAVLETLAAYGVPEKYYQFDMSLARGLDYYTGPIFETIVKAPAIGSITGGGRYDGLIGLFAKQPIPATGISFGLERLVTVLEDKGSSQERGTKTKVLLTLFDAAMMGENLKIAKTLREAGLNTEIYYTPHKLKKQLTYAANRGVPFVLILGPDEAGEAMITLRYMDAGSQVKIPQSELVRTIKDMP